MLKLLAIILVTIGLCVLAEYLIEAGTAARHSHSHP